MSWSAALISFGPGLDAELRRRTASAAYEWRAIEDLTLTAAAGAAIDGDLTLGRRHDIGPGPLGSLGVGWRVLDGDGWEPFLLLGGAASVTSAETEAGGSGARLTAVDFRASVTVGEVLGDHVGPYLAARGFGGPIFWKFRGEDVTGSDRQHFAVGGGVMVTTGTVDAFLEVVPLGERSLTSGMAISF